MVSGAKSGSNSLMGHGGAGEGDEVGERPTAALSSGLYKRLGAYQ